VKPCLFIVGCARSGTTLLGRIVDAHPEIGVAPSIHWIAGHLRRRGVRAPDDLVTAELVRGLADDRRLARFGIEPEELEALVPVGGRVEYRRFLAAFLELYARKRDKPRVGNKTASFVRRIRALHDAWPEARFIHLIRDGRDVCLSALSWRSAERSLGRYPTWNEDPVSTVAFWWDRKVRAGREAGDRLEPGLYREVRYEALVGEPARECVALCGFLGVPFDEAMVRFEQGATSGDAELDGAHPWLPITAGLRDWRTQMPDEDVERFEALAGDLLEELGYPRAFPQPGREARRQAAKVRELLEGEAGAVAGPRTE
jgi:Sulfotransferase family